MALAATLSFVSVTSEAATFRVEFAGNTLGTVTYSDDAKIGSGGQVLRTDLNNTPFGLFDGTFEAGSRPDGATAGSTRTRYASKSRSTRKSREISFLIDAGRVKETVVSPVGEMTPLSAPEAVMADVIDPVAAFGRFVRAGRCPEGFNIYDGRRVDQVAPSSFEVSGGLTRCEIKYTVVAGPGH
ncbi:MAG: hypothetical protein B7Z02_18245, partial [Rhodobacterales bacterium 32-67-9]